MKHYIGIVHQEGDSAFGIHFPDVPGCFSAADRFDDLLPNATEALSLFFEDEMPVEARSMDDLRRDPGVRAELESGAFFMAVPHIEVIGKRAKANIAIDAGLLSAIDDTAAARGLTRSAFLAGLARREIEGR